MKRIALLGATGSIGTQTLDVVRALPGRFNVVGITTHRRWREAFAQAAEFRPRVVVVTDETLRGEVEATSLPAGCRLAWGQSEVEALAAATDVDVVVAAMVGAAGLRGALAAVAAGKDLALANKETLVVAGELVVAAAARSGSRLLPVDSEHSAVFQCLAAGRRAEVARVVLTASGGPFRTRPLEDFATIAPADALKHPNWDMGPKITVDSATMMNKALELIEARWLFDLPAERLGVAIHPQSVVHSFVEFADGSVLAQASPPDMRMPIQYALTFPERLPGPARKMDWGTAAAWEFFPPDPRRYPALALGYEVVRAGGNAGAALNAANEAAVARFLVGDLRFADIVPLCADVLRRRPPADGSLAGLLRTDEWARQEAAAWTCTSSPLTDSSLLPR